MGVHGLWPILEASKKSCKLDDLSGKTLAVDLGCWIVEMNSIEARNMYKRNLFHRCVSLLSHNVSLIFVLEGEVPALKAETMRQRRMPHKLTNSNDDTSNANFKRSHFDNTLQECKEMLELLGACCIKSSGEAEALCARLNNHGVVDGCITDDNDAFLYGAKVVYRNFSANKYASMDMYCINEIESKLNLDQTKLVSLAILLGCDYLPKGVPGVGKEKAMKLLRKDSSTNILQRFQEWKDPNFGKKIEERSEQHKNLKHCTKCRHQGVKRTHNIQGCNICATPSGCIENSSCACPCDLHSNPITDEEELEMSVRGHALKVESFPCTNVADEYLNYTDSWDADSLIRSRPQFKKFMNYAADKFHWNYNSSFDKIVPVLIGWDLYCLDKNLSNNFFFKPNSILKKAKLVSNDCYQVKWDLVDPSVGLPHENYQVTSLERVSFIQRVLPELSTKFEQEQGTSTQPSPSTVTKSPQKRKFDASESAGQLKMTDLLKQTKPRNLSSENSIDIPIVDLIH